MKNHIKNYIKIMGLAAVPFGTAQVHGANGRIRVEKYTLREGVYCIEIMVSRFGGEKVIGRAIEYQWDAVSFKLVDGSGGADIFPKNGVTSLKDLKRFAHPKHFAHPIYFLKGVIPGIIRDGTHIASFYAGKGDESKVWSWWFTGYLCWFKGTFNDVMLVLCIDDRESLGIISDVLVLVLKNCCNILDNVVYGYDKTFRFADTKSLVASDKFACLNRIPAPLEYFLLEELYFGSKEDSKEERKRIEEERRRKEQRRRIQQTEEDKYSSGDSDCSATDSGDEPDLSSEEPTPTQARIKALFEADRARREKDPEREKERRMREEAQIRARNRIQELIRIDLESRKIKESNKIEKNEIVLEDPKVEDKKEEMSKVFFSKLSGEDYFKGFDAFKENLSTEFEKNLKRNKSEKNEIKIEDKKSKEPEIFKSEDCFEFHESRFEFSEVVNSNRIKIEDKKEDKKIDQSEITFGNKSFAKSIYNNKSSKKSGKSNKSDDEDSEKSDDRDSVSKLTLGSYVD